MEQKLKLNKKTIIIIVSSCIAFVLMAIGAVILFLPKGTTHMPEMPSDDSAAESTLNIEMEDESETESESESETESETESESESETETETTKAPETEEVKVDGISLSVTEVSLTVGEKQMPIVTMSPRNATDKSEKWSSSNTAVATVNQYGDIRAVGEGSCTVTVVSANNPDVYADVSVTVKAKPAPVTEPPSQGSSEGPTYINGILIVNKTYSLPESYSPGVDGTAYIALQKMFSAASEDGISLWVASGYRSYSSQKRIYNNYCAKDGQAEADRYSARPGHSEHQSGLAFDLNLVDQSFADTAAGKWLAANCHRYGFIIRYPQGKESVTGYMYEPWHVRYIGTDYSTAVYNSGLCLEEYLGITSVYAD